MNPTGTWFFLQQQSVFLLLLLLPRSFVFSALVLSQTDSHPSSVTHCLDWWPPLNKQPVLSFHPGAFHSNKIPISSQRVLLSHGDDVIKQLCFVSCRIGSELQYKERRQRAKDGWDLFWFVVLNSTFCHLNACLSLTSSEWAVNIIFASR